MYSLYKDNRNDCYKLIPHFDDNCDYYISPNLHVENCLKANCANIYGNIQIDGFATIYQDLTLFGNLNLINGNVVDYTSEVKVSDSLIISGDAINDSLVVCQNSNAKEISIFKSATENILVISPNRETSITGNTNISGNINVTGNIVITSPSRIRNSIGNIDPSVGDIKMSVRNSDFDGWLLCDGRLLSVTLYSELFSLIGYTFGGSGSQFNLPNSAGRTLGSSDVTYPIGTYTGSATNTLVTANLPPHTHSGTTSTVGNHTHNYNDAYFAENVGGGSNYGTSAGTDTDNAFIWRTAAGGWSTSPSDIATSSSGSHNHSFTTDNGTGSSTSFSIMQPTLFIGYTFIYGGV